MFTILFQIKKIVFAEYFKVSRFTKRQTICINKATIIILFLIIKAK